MDDNQKPFIAPRFTGVRFNGALPLSVLEDLSAYEDLLIDVAKYIYLEEHTDRKRIPNGFNDGVSLTLTDIEPGSAIPKILLVSTLGMFEPGHIYFEKARDRIENVIEQASHGEDVNRLLPDHLLKRFNRIGKNLLDDEAIEFNPNASTKKAILNKATRKTIVLSAGDKYFIEKTSLRSKVTSYDKQTKEATIRFGDSTLTVLIPKQYQQLVIEAYHQFESNDNRILIIGDAKIDRTDKIESFEKVEKVEKLDVLDVPSRVDDLYNIKDGWYNGIGIAPDKRGLKWFAQSFTENFDSELPLPTIFPKVEGDIELEWNSPEYSASLEVDLKDRNGEYFFLTKATKFMDQRKIDLKDPDGWVELNQLLQILKP